MNVDQRVRAARLTYMRAVAAARAKPTPAAWARVRAAAHELNAAVRDADAAERSARIPPQGA
jgi:hypothetical protein